LARDIAEGPVAKAGGDEELLPGIGTQQPKRLSNDVAAIGIGVKHQAGRSPLFRWRRICREGKRRGRQNQPGKKREGSQSPCPDGFRFVVNELHFTHLVNTMLQRTVGSHLSDSPEVVCIRCVLGPKLKPRILCRLMANIDIFRHQREAPIVKSMNLSLTDELRAFVNRNSGDGTLYATPSEFLRDVLREKKERMEAAELRDGIVEGYRDLIEGRVVEFKGNLRKVIKEAKRREAKGWE
jgi:antitoxin ParD1/3/4